ncbi:18180_t:CDS:1, partial [Cetraspora pellucida]
IDDNKVIYTTDVQNEASLLNNNELNKLLNELPIEDNHATALSSAMINFLMILIKLLHLKKH